MPEEPKFQKMTYLHAYNSSPLSRKEGMTKSKENTSISLNVWSENTVDTIIISKKTLKAAFQIPLWQLQPMFFQQACHSTATTGGATTTTVLQHLQQLRLPAQPTTKWLLPNNKKWAINLSSILLNLAQTSLLARGPNFAFTPKHSQGSLHNCHWGSVYQTFPRGGGRAKSWNQPFAKVHLPYQTQHPMQEFKAIKELREDQSRVVLTVHKGMAMVIMDKKD